MYIYTGAQKAVKPSVLLYIPVLLTFQGQWHNEQKRLEGGPTARPHLHVPSLLTRYMWAYVDDQVERYVNPLTLGSRAWAPAGGQGAESPRMSIGVLGKIQTLWSDKNI